MESKDHEPMQGQTVHRTIDNGRPSILQPRRDIGWAIKQMWNGQAVTRSAWYGNHRLRLQLPDEHSKMNQPYIYITTQRNEIIPWLASQADLLAVDWKLHEVE